MLKHAARTAETSFPRRRESSNFWILLNQESWTPAYAGATGFGKGNGQVVAAAGATMAGSLADETAAYDHLYP